MARLKLSASGLRSPLDLSTADATPAPAPALPPRIVPPTELEDLGLATPDAPADATPRVDAPQGEAPTNDAAPTTTGEPAPAPVERADDVPAPSTPAGASAATSSDSAAAATDAPAVASAPTVTGGASAGVDTSDLPAWAAPLGVVALAPARLLGRPKQTALILDRDLSSRADALVAATGPRVTFAAVVTAILHFHLPADGEAAARTIGAYRRRKLEALDHPWEERNARLPEPLRAELDDVVAGATGRVASVHRSTLVNALLDAHLPATPEDASRLVTRMEMVRGGAFLDHVG